MNTTEKFKIDNANNALVLKRTIATTPERLFDAWTKPEQISKWWDPSGRELVECIIELKQGGILRLVNAGQEDHPFEGHYREIVRPEKIIFDAMGAEGSVLFIKDGDKTHLNVTIKCSSKEQLEQFVLRGIGTGTALSIDNLEEFLKNNS